MLEPALLPWIAAGAALLLVVVLLFATRARATAGRDALAADLAALRATLELVDQRAQQLASLIGADGARLRTELATTFAEQRTRAEE